jgi:hypothetical protein
MKTELENQMELRETRDLLDKAIHHLEVVKRRVQAGMYPILGLDSKPCDLLPAKIEDTLLEYENLKEAYDE